MSGSRVSKRTRAALVNFSDDFALGTRAIAGFVRPHGYRCDLIFMKRHNRADYHLTDRNYDDLISLLRDLDPTVIGLSVATKTLPYAEQASARIRAAFPRATLLWGGWHVTMNPEAVLATVDVDAAAVGESEATMLDVLERIEHGASLAGCHGLWVNAPVVERNPHRPLIANLDDIPYFRYDESPSYLIDDSGIQPFATLPMFGRRDRYGYPIMTSRGCPYNCSFCSVPFMKELYRSDEGKYLRRRSVDSVIAELEYARDVLGANYVWFFDEELLFYRRWVRQFLEVYRDRIGLDYYCEAHPDSFPDEAFIDLLTASGLKDLEIGLQSASQETLSLYNRPHRTQDTLVRLSKRLARTGVMVTYDVILDNPLEPACSVRETLDYLLRLERPFRVEMFPLAFRENYPLTNTLIARGLITRASFETNVLAQEREDPASRGDVHHRARVGEFPFVSLSPLNCLIFLSQVDLIPKSWLRALARGTWAEEHRSLLAALVMFLHRTGLAYAGVSGRSLRRLSARLGGRGAQRRMRANGAPRRERSPAGEEAAPS